MLDGSCSVPHAQLMTFTKNIGMLLLAIYLILVGLMGIFGMSLGAASIVVPILALVAGILILLGK